MDPRIAGRHFEPVDRLQNDRLPWLRAPAILGSVHSKSYDCLQPTVRKVLANMLCRLTDVRHAPSEPPAKRILADGDRRKRVRSAAAARCAWLSWTAFPTKNSSLSIISYEKASQVFEEKELDKHSAVRGCQAGGSGEGEWSRRVALHEDCMGVQVHTGTRIRWDAHQTFFCMKVRGRGGGQSKFFGNTDLKNFQNYGRPLGEYFFFLTLDSTFFTLSSHFGLFFLLSRITVSENFFSLGFPCGFTVSVESSVY